MEIIEIFVYVCIASMMVFCLNVINKTRLAKRSDFIYFGVLLSLITTQILIQISPEIRGSIHIITYICIGMILALVLVYLLTRITVSTPEIHENIRGWIVWTMFLVLGISICMLLIEFPNTKADLFRIPLALALCIGMVYYPLTLDQLIGMKGDAEKSTPDEIAPEDSIPDESVPEDSMADESADGYKEAIIKLATESWHFTTVYQRMLTILDASDHRKYTSQLRWHIKKMEESLEEGGLRIVNVEGQPYDPNMAVTPVNIEDFDEDVPLVVSRMLEPIIMEGTTLAKMGRVTLKRRIIEE